MAVWHRPDRRPVEPEDEGDWFRTGRYADYLVAHRRPVPAWAWLNALAEGSEVLVASLALAEPGPRDAAEELRGWYALRKALAEEVVGTIGAEGCSLAEVQAAVLAGLELELAAASAWSAPDTDEVSAIVLQALQSFRDHSRQ